MPFSGKLSLQEALQRGLALQPGRGRGDANRASKQRAGDGWRAAPCCRTSTAISAKPCSKPISPRSGCAFSVPGFHIPTVVGPYNYFALQASLSQTVANLTAIDNYRSAKATARASQYSLQDARDLVTLAVGGAYLQVLAAQARVDAAQAQLDTANAVFHQSTEQHRQGVLAQLNVDQSQVQTLTQQQQIITLRNDLAKQKINLARLTGLPPNADYQLTDSFPFSPAPVQSVDDAVAQRRTTARRPQGRPIAGGGSREGPVGRARRAPALGFGQRRLRGDRHQPRPIARSLHRGRHAQHSDLARRAKPAGDIAQAEAVLAQRQAELEDTRGQIEAEVREAYLDLEAAAGQVEVARKNLQVAQETLEMTRARMEAGVINTVEVVQAQQTVSSAQLDLINSVFAHNLAKLSLARALGHAEQLPPCSGCKCTNDRPRPEPSIR